MLSGDANESSQKINRSRKSSAIKKCEGMFSKSELRFSSALESSAYLKIT